jgi:hypothetical protein
MFEKMIEKSKELFSNRGITDTTSVKSDLDKGIKSDVIIGQGDSITSPSNSISVADTDVKMVQTIDTATTTASGIEIVNHPLKPRTLPHEQEKENAPLTFKEMKAMQKAGYEKIVEDKKFTKMFVLKNIKTNQIAEIRAASSFHACNIIGWKANKVVVIQEKEAN